MRESLKMELQLISRIDLGFVVLFDGALFREMHVIPLVPLLGYVALLTLCTGRVIELTNPIDDRTHYSQRGEGKELHILGGFPSLDGLDQSHDAVGNQVLSEDLSIPGKRAETNGSELAHELQVMLHESVPIFC